MRDDLDIGDGFLPEPDETLTTTERVLLGAIWALAIVGSLSVLRAVWLFFFGA